MSSDAFPQRKSEDFVKGKNFLWFNGFGPVNERFCILTVADTNFSNDCMNVYAHELGKTLSGSLPAPINNYSAWKHSVSHTGVKVFSPVNYWFVTPAEACWYAGYMNDVDGAEKITVKLMMCDYPSEDRKDYLLALLRWIDFWRNPPKEVLEFAGIITDDGKGE